MKTFYNKKEIFEKINKFYTSGKVFIDYMENSNLFPLKIKLKQLKQTDIRDNYSNLLQQLTILKKENFELEYKEYNFKNIGLQKLPIFVCFENMQNYLEYISKVEEFELFKLTYKKIIYKYPKLKELLIKKHNLVLENMVLWDKIFLVCDFFIENIKLNIYVRELSIKGVDTKFIEKNQKILDTLFVILLKKENINSDIKLSSSYGFEKRYYLKYPMPTLRFRILDKTQTIYGLSDISVTIDEFKELKLQCKNVFIVENKITTLSFPTLKDSIVIFGSGYGVEVLKNIDWLNSKKLFYWGDIDKDGFAILSQIRGCFNHIESIFMDEDIIKRFIHYSSTDKSVVKELKNLKIDESLIYENLSTNYYGKDFRLEQEKVDFDYIKSYLYKNF